MVEVNQEMLLERQIQLSSVVQDNNLHQAMQFDYAMFRATYTHFPDPILILNPQLEVIFANPAFVKILGYPENDMLGKNPAQICVNTDDTAHFQKIARETNYHQIQFKHQNDDIIEGKTTFIPFYVDDIACGQIIIIQDVTIALEQSKQLARRQELAIDLIGTSDLSGRFQSLNQPWESILGYETDELIDADPRDFVHPDERDIAKVQFNRLKQGQRVENLLIRFRCKDNSYKWLLWNALPFPDENLFYFNIRDVTVLQEAKNTLDIQQKHLKIIYDITVKSNLGFEAQIDSLLKAGIEYFGLKQGVIGQKEGDYLRALYVGVDGYYYEQNKLVAFNKTYCQYALESIDVVAVIDTHEKPYSEHSAAQYFHGYFIAMPIWIGRNNLGVLAFFSEDKDKRAEPFTATDHEFMRMLGQLTNNLLTQRAAQIEAERIYNLTTDLIAIIDANGYFHRLSSAWNVQLGYELSELYAMRLQDLLHPDDKEAWGFDLPPQAFEDKDTAPFEVRLCCKDGTYRWVAWSATVSPESLLYFVGHDVTDRRRILARLQDREQRLSSILNSIDDLIIVYDKEGYFLDFHVPNPNMLYLPIDQMHGKNVYDVLPNHVHGMLKRIFNEVSTTGETVTDDYWLDMDGERRWFSAHFSPMRDENAQIVAITCGIREITDRKNLEIELLNANAEMTIRVQRRTMELEHINEELKNFAYIISHDLRNPLINIQGFLSELEHSLKTLSTPDDAPVLSATIEKDINESIAFIRSSATEMNQKIDAILRLSRMGRRDLTFVDVNLNTVVAEEFRSHAHQIKEMDVTAEILPVILADYLAVKIIIGNILSNAIKYLVPNRRGNVHIAVQRNENDFILSIADNGRGIPASQADRVFKLFRRVGSFADGEGMGLAYVQTLVRRHDGRIWFESEEGVGTTFYISLPSKLIIRDAPDE